jgi:hypothetical protein
MSDLLKSKLNGILSTHPGILFQGTYHELMAREGEFAEFLVQYLTEKGDKPMDPQVSQEHALQVFDRNKIQTKLTLLF